MKRHGGNLKCMLLREKNLYESNYMTFWKRKH